MDMFDLIRTEPENLDKGEYFFAIINNTNSGAGDADDPPRFINGKSLKIDINTGEISKNEPLKIIDGVFFNESFMGIEKKHYPKEYFVDMPKRMPQYGPDPEHHDGVYGGMRIFDPWVIRDIIYDSE
jgi:hypothetical protein